MKSRYFSFTLCIVSILVSYVASKLSSLDNYSYGLGLSYYTSVIDDDQNFSYVLEILNKETFPETPLNLLVKMTIDIETTTRVITWEGCIYKLYSFPSGQNDRCTKCASNSTNYVRFNARDKQRYKNCSTECGRPTLCTDYKYHIEGKWTSECYQCGQANNERITFALTRLSDVCPVECKTCALEADLATAQDCAFICKGYPTFCYPVDLRFGQRLCYRATRLYGCRYFPIDSKFLDEECLGCARHRNMRWMYSQECAAECGGKPTFHSKLKSNNNGTSSYTYYQCRLAKYGPVQVYNYPPYIIKFLRLSKDESDILKLGQSYLNKSALLDQPNIDSDREYDVLDNLNRDLESG